MDGSWSLSTVLTLKFSVVSLRFPLKPKQRGCLVVEGCDCSSVLVWVSLVFCVQSNKGCVQPFCVVLIFLFFSLVFVWFLVANVITHQVLCKCFSVYIGSLSFRIIQGFSSYCFNLCYYSPYVWIAVEDDVLGRLVRI